MRMPINSKSCPIASDMAMNNSFACLNLVHSYDDLHGGSYGRERPKRFRAFRRQSAGYHRTRDTADRRSDGDSLNHTICVNEVEVQTFLRRTTAHVDMCVEGGRAGE